MPKIRFICFLLVSASALKKQFLEYEPQRTSVKAPSSPSSEDPSERSLRVTVLQAADWWAWPVVKPLQPAHVSGEQDADMPRMQRSSFHIVENLQARDGYPGTALSIVLSFAIVAGLICILCLQLTETEEEKEEKVKEKVKEEKDEVNPVDMPPLAHPMSEQDLKYSQPNLPEVPEATPPKSAEDLRFAVQGYGAYAGTWAEVYQNATDSQQEALELLFRCGIIPVQEFTSSRVRMEHVSECVWIAEDMLRRKKLEAWVTSWAEAQQVFEESVTQCFSTRTDALHSTGHKDKLSSDSGGQPSRNQQEASDDPYVTNRRPIGVDKELTTAVDSSGRNKLIMRCREIMSSTPSRAATTPKSATSPRSPKLSSVPPTVPEADEEKEEGEEIVQTSAKEDDNMPRIIPPNVWHHIPEEAASQSPPSAAEAMPLSSQSVEATPPRLKLKVRETPVSDLYGSPTDNASAAVFQVPSAQQLSSPVSVANKSRGSSAADPFPSEDAEPDVKKG